MPRGFLPPYVGLPPHHAGSSGKFHLKNLQLSLIMILSKFHKFTRIFLLRETFPQNHGNVNLLHIHGALFNFITASVELF